MGQPAPTGDVRSIAADVLAQIAPDDLPQLDAAMVEVARDPDRVPRPRDEELGFGGAIFGVSMAVVVPGWSTRRWVSRPAWCWSRPPSRCGRGWPSCCSGSRCSAGSAARPLATAPPRPLTRAELAKVKAATLESAAAAGVAPDTATLLADAIVGRLATEP